MEHSINTCTTESGQLHVQLYMYLYMCMPTTTQQRVHVQQRTCTIAYMSRYSQIGKLVELYSADVSMCPCVLIKIMESIPAQFGTDGASKRRSITFWTALMLTLRGLRVCFKPESDRLERNQKLRIYSRTLELVRPCLLIFVGCSQNRRMLFSDKHK